MTDKLAVLVEGQTGQIFVETLMCEIASGHRVHTDTVKANGGRVFPRRRLEVNASGPDAGEEYYVPIVGSASDSRVLSDIRDHYERLTQEGYRGVIGWHDLAPFARSDEETAREDFVTLAPRGRLPVTRVLAVTEIEAWLIAEHSHFLNISRANTSGGARRPWIRPRCSRRATDSQPIR